MQSSTDKIALHLVHHRAPAELCPAINDRAWPGDLLASHGRSACHASEYWLAGPWTSHRPVPQR